MLGYLLLLLWGFAMIWVGILVGSSLRSVEAVQGVMFTVIFPLTFLANTFAPTENMPTVLRTIAEWNPISALVQAVRVLWHNGPPAPADAALAAAEPHHRDADLDDPDHRGDGAAVAAGVQPPHRRLRRLRVALLERTKTITAHWCCGIRAAESSRRVSAWPGRSSSRGPRPRRPWPLAST